MIRINRYHGNQSLFLAVEMLTSSKRTTATPGIHYFIPSSLWTHSDDDQGRNFPPFSDRSRYRRSPGPIDSLLEVSFPAGSSRKSLVMDAKSPPYTDPCIVIDQTDLDDLKPRCRH